MMSIASNRAPAPRGEAEIASEAAALLYALEAITRLPVSNGRFALGSEVSLADGSLLAFLTFARYATEYLDTGPLRRRPLIFDYFDRVSDADACIGRVLQELLQATGDRRSEVTQRFGIAI